MKKIALLMLMCIFSLPLYAQQEKFKSLPGKLTKSKQLYILCASNSNLDYELKYFLCCITSKTADNKYVLICHEEKDDKSEFVYIFLGSTQLAAMTSLGVLINMCDATEFNVKFLDNNSDIMIVVNPPSKKDERCIEVRSDRYAKGRFYFYKQDLINFLVCMSNFYSNESKKLK